MTSALHIIGALIISAAIVSLILSVNYSMQIESTESVADARVQQDVELLKSIFKDEFRKIGQGMDNTWYAFNTDRSNGERLSYFQRIDDTVVLTELFLVPNEENDSWTLYRQEYHYASRQLTGYSEPEVLMANIVKIEFTYYNYENNRTSQPDNATRFINVEVVMQSSDPVDGEYLVSAGAERYLLRQLLYRES